MSPATAQLVLGVIPIVIGIGFVYWINRRKFNRRNVAGIEGVSSYEASVFIRFLERIGKILAYILLLVGIFFVCIYISENNRKKNKEIITETSSVNKYSK